MSDNESYYSDSNSEDENEEYSVSKSNLDKKKQPIFINAARKYGTYIEDSDSDIDDSEVNSENSDIDENEDTNNLDNTIQKGGQEDDADDSDNDDIPIDEEDEDEDDDDIEIDDEGVVIEKNNKYTKKQLTNQIIIDDNDDDDDDEYDENYLQKFDSELNKNYISEYHSECLNHNYDEVLKMSKVIRDNNNNIIDPLHRTLPYLTKYEKTRILGQRAKQIENGSKPFVKVPENVIDGYIIAELELREKKIPFIIKRPIPGGGFEYWRLNDLENIDF